MDRPGLQPPVHYVVHRAAALQGLPNRPQQPPLARRGEEQDLTQLELAVPRASLFLGSLHLHEYRVDADPRERGREEYRRQRDEDHEGRNTDGGRRDGEEGAQDQERYGEAYRHLEPALVVGDNDVTRPLRERLRLVGVLALEDDRQVVPAHAELPNIRDGLVEPGPVVHDPYHGVPRSLLRDLPPFRQNAYLQRGNEHATHGGFQPATSITLSSPSHTSPPPTPRGDLFHNPPGFAPPCETVHIPPRALG